MSVYDIAVIEGDGIGPEVVGEGLKVLEAVSDLSGIKIEFTKYPFGANHYLKTNEVLGEDGLKALGKHDAILFGAIGDPRVEPGLLEKGILLTTRFHLDQYVNLRPIKLLEGVETPLANKGPKDVDFTVVRENTEDFYVGLGSTVSPGKSSEHMDFYRSLYSIKFGLDLEVDGDEIAYQIGVSSKKGCERIIRYAFEYAAKYGRDSVSSVDKANVLTHMYGMWRNVFSEVAAGYPEIKTDFNYVDAITMWMVRQPERYQVIVTPNMFGDIITDLGAMIQGGLGFAPGGNINPEGTSMFEPIHGSAPEIAGRGVANPIATIWSSALMLSELGEDVLYKNVLTAIEQVIKKRDVRTPDLGGSQTTSEMGDAIAAELVA